MNFLRSELKNLIEETSSEAGIRNKLVTFEATVVSGFEHQAVVEIKEKLKTSSIFRIRGHVFFNASADDYETKILKLRSVDNLYIVLHNFGPVEFNPNDKVSDLDVIKSFAIGVDWKAKLPMWADLVHFDGILFPDKPSSAPDSVEVNHSSSPVGDPVAEAESNESVAPVGVSDVAASPTEEPNLPDVVLTDDSKNVGLKPDARGDFIGDETKITDDGSTDDFLSCSSGNEDLDLDRLGITDCCRGNQMENGKTEGIREKLEAEARKSGLTTPEAKPCGSSPPETEKSDCCGLDPKKFTTSASEKADNLRREVNKPLASVSETETPASSQRNISVTDSPENISTSVPDGEGLSLATTERTAVFDVPLDSKPSAKEDNKPRAQRRDKRRTNGRNENQKSKRVLKPYVDDGILKFRATCVRNGRHSFSSMEAAWDFGGTLNDTFFWTVDLTRFNLNAVLVIEHDFVYVTAALTEESLHRRNITHFGPTTLRATTCYHLIHMAEPVTGEIVVDPMCGGGSIPIEGSLAFPGTFHLGGDHHDRAITRINGNLKSFSDKGVHLKVDAFSWDSLSLPLKDNSVDVVVTDLPYGIRIGRRKDNRPFYSKALKEIARVVRSGLGRAVLMTEDDVALMKALRENEQSWKLIRSAKISHGGLRAVAFLLLKKKL